MRSMVLTSMMGDFRRAFCEDFSPLHEIVAQAGATMHNKLATQFHALEWQLEEISDHTIKQLKEEMEWNN